MEKLTFENFEHKYRHLLSDDIACLYWNSKQEAYEAYLKGSEDEFMEKLNDHIDYAKFCKKFYDILREQYNACGIMMYDEFQRWEALGSKDEEYIKYLRGRIRDFDKYYGYEFGTRYWHKVNYDDESDEEDDDEEDED